MHTHIYRDDVLRTVSGSQSSSSVPVHRYRPYSCSSPRGPSAHTDGCCEVRKSVYVRCKFPGQRVYAVFAGNKLYSECVCTLQITFPNENKNLSTEPCI